LAAAIATRLPAAMHAEIFLAPSSNSTWHNNRKPSPVVCRPQNERFV
jgi:hypothetical protein